MLLVLQLNNLLQAGTGLPTFVGPVISDFTLILDSAMTPVDYSAYFTSDLPLTYSSAGATLPTGLSFSSAGVLSGTPTVLGATADVQWGVTDGSDNATSNLFTITVSTAPAWSEGTRIGGLAVSDTGAIGTIYLNDATAVPAGSFFFNGIAHASDGRRYICLWPANGAVHYRGATACRSDGAMIIVTAGTIADRPHGWAMTSRGEVLATVSASEIIKDAIGQLQSGYVCMEEVS